jgi:hypothetical protein
MMMMKNKFFFYIIFFTTFLYASDGLVIWDNFEGNKPLNEHLLPRRYDADSNSSIHVTYEVQQKEKKRFITWIKKLLCPCLFPRKEKRDDSSVADETREVDWY